MAFKDVGSTSQPLHLRMPDGSWRTYKGGDTGTPLYVKQDDGSWKVLTRTGEPSSGPPSQGVQYLWCQGTTMLTGTEETTEPTTVPAYAFNLHYINDGVYEYNYHFVDIWRILPGFIEAFNSDERYIIERGRPFHIVGTFLDGEIPPDEYFLFMDDPNYIGPFAVGAVYNPDG